MPPVEHGFLQDLVIVFGLGLLVVLVFSKIRLPSLVGFLLTGILVGPHGLQLVSDRHNVELLAEVGIVILLFTIGVEFSLARLLRLGSIIVVSGMLQVVVTGAAAAGVAVAVGLPAGPAILVGCIVALSSTAIVMRLLSDRAETGSPQGRISLGILMFQDLAIVPMILAVPFLAGPGGGWGEVGLALLKAAGVVVAVLIVARVVIPRLLHMVVRTRSRELFLLSIIVVCLGTAWLTSEVGLSLGLGAFLAGLTVSESEYSHHTLGTILPFRDAFTSLFFVSIGMLLDIGFVASHPLVVVTTTVGILGGKAVIAAVLTRMLGYHVRIAALVGILLSQIGEFSFLLMHAGNQAGVLTGATHQLLMAATVLTMAVTPVAVRVSPGLSRWIARAFPPHMEPDQIPELKDQVIIVGYGVNGQNVARVLRHVRMPYVVLELNPETVRRLRKEGETVLYGDATQTDALRCAGIERARVMVVTIPEAASARQVVKIAHDLNPAVHLIVRSRSIGEVGDLYRLGANEVVPEEFETSIEIFSRVLRTYMVPRDVVDLQVRETRRKGYEMFRAQHEEFRPVEGLRRLLADVEFEVYRVAKESSLVGKTLIEAGIRQETGALVVAMHRKHVTTPNPPAGWRLEVDDVAVLLGPPEALSKAGMLFSSA